MGIKSVEIKNCKSIKHIRFQLNNINCLLGENGTGKTNIMKAIKYFYSNLIDKRYDESLFDRENPYIQEFQITFFYDFTRLIKISESHSQRKELHGYKLNPLFKKIIRISKEYGNSNGEVKITLIQGKNNTPQWNVPYEIRAFIKSIFPIYFCQTRHIDLINWNELWEVIGELGRVSISGNSSLDKEIEGSFKDLFGERYSKVFDYIKNELEENEIELKSFDSNEKFANIYQVNLGGEIFKHKLENLEYFSDGVNSFNYIKLLINLVSKISDLKIKEPTIIIDEPEIGLHPKYIDNMVEIFFNKSKNTNLIISTHSSRIVKNLIVDNKNVNLYQISIGNKYTQLEKMKGFTDERERNNITEQEASYYFAKSIVFVEGVSELELFSNKNIQNMFPFLGDVNFYSYDGNKVKLKIINPQEKKITIPYLILLDLDKLLQYEKSNLKFVSKKGDIIKNPLTDKDTEKKEIFFYGDKRKRTYNIRKRIIGLISKSKFNFDEHWGYVIGDSSYFNLLRKLIKSHSLEYNVFPVSTTIEGALINRANYEKVYT